MIRSLRLTAGFLILASGLFAQDEVLLYSELPSYPENFTSGAVAARVIDGLGFRFYWATEGLREMDLGFKPSVDARSSEETIEHIYTMSVMIKNATTGTLNTPDQDGKHSFAEMRRRTLENLNAASIRLRLSTDEEIKDYKALFKRGDKIVEIPFWNMLNGPIADCLWHVGQIVSFRRSSGNPFSEKVNVFYGTVSK